MECLSIRGLSNKLKQGNVIIYPTESVFGLGCNPDNKNAVYALLNIKRRSWDKGFILVAADYIQALKYVDDSLLSNEQRMRVFSTWSDPVTWVFPARSNVPYWLTGKFYSTIAIRISRFEPIKRICLCFGNPIVSTSANLSGFPMTRTVDEVYKQFKTFNLSMLNENVLGLSNTSQIRDVKTGKIIRK